LKTPAIVLSSHTIGLNVIRSLGIHGIPIHVLYYEKKDMGYVSRFVSGKTLTPHPEKDEDIFIEILLKFASRYKGSVLIPADDATLTTVSKNKDILSEQYNVACPHWNVTEKFIDKKYTYELAHSAGVPVPKTFTPQSFAEVKKYAESTEYPCLVKPRKSHIYFECFKKKMVKVADKNELIAAYNEASSTGIDILIQEYIPGNDTSGVNYNSYFLDGKPLVEFTARKCRLNPPEFGVPRVVKSAVVPEVIEYGRRIIQALGFNGYSCTEFKKDSRTGQYKLMEVNGRHNRSGLLALKCGINFPLIEYNYLTTCELPEKSDFRKNIYWIDEVADIFCSIKHIKKERLSIIDFIKPYINPHIFAVFDATDLKPFLKRIYDISLMALKKIVNPDK